MSTLERPARAVQRVESELVERCLRKIGGGVHVGELAYKTGLSESEIIDALYELEEHGRAAPWAWTLGTNSKPSEARP